MKRHSYIFTSKAYIKNVFRLQCIEIEKRCTVIFLWYRGTLYIITVHRQKLFTFMASIKNITRHSSPKHYEQVEVFETAKIRCQEIDNNCLYNISLNIAIYFLIKNLKTLTYFLNDFLCTLVLSFILAHYFGCKIKKYLLKYKI